MKKRWIAALLVLAMALTLVACGGAEEAAEEERPVTTGVIEDGVYYNEYAGISFTADGWQLLGVEDLKDSLDGVSELLEGTEVGDAMKDLTQFMDMQAVDPSGLQNINVIYTKMSAAERLAFLALDEEGVIDAVLKNQESLIHSYEEGGITVESMEKVSCNFAGEDRIGILTTGSVQGIPCFILQVYETHAGAYSVITTMTAAMEDTTADMAAMFSAYGE